MARRPTRSLFLAGLASSLVVMSCSKGDESDEDKLGGDGLVQVPTTSVASDLGSIVDEDGDGTADMIDIDGDGIFDGLGIDTNGDGIADAVGIDSDNDGVADGIDRDGDGVVDQTTMIPASTGGSSGSSGTGGNGTGASSSAGGTPITGSGGSTVGTGGASVGTGGMSQMGSGGSGTGGSEPVCDNNYMAFSCDMLGTWPTDQAQEEEALLVIVNQHRASGANCGGENMPAVGPLVMDETLRCAARVHSQDMADRGFFSHRTWNPNACECNDEDDCPSGMGCDNRQGDEPIQRCGKNPATRVSEVGGPSGAGWENIAAGNGTAEGTMEQWMSSTGHCRNIMNGDLKTIGVGYAQGGSYGNYWTQAFDN